MCVVYMDCVYVYVCVCVSVLCLWVGGNGLD